MQWPGKATSRTGDVSYLKLGGGCTQVPVCYSLCLYLLDIFQNNLNYN